MEPYLMKTCGAGCYCWGAVMICVFGLTTINLLSVVSSVSGLPRILRITHESSLVTEKPDNSLILGTGIYSITNSEGITNTGEIPDVVEHQVYFDVWAMVHNVTWQDSEMWYEASEHLRFVYNSDLSNAPVTQPIVTPSVFYGLSMGHSPAERLEFFKAELSSPKTIDSNFFGAAGMFALFGTCVSDRDLDAELAACPQISGAGMYGAHLTRWSYFTGVDDPGKWQVYKDFPATLGPKTYLSLYEDFSKVSLPFPLGMDNTGSSNTFPVLDDDDYTWHEKELFRNEQLVKLGEEEYLGFPVYRFAPSESMLSLNNKYFVYRAGWFNLSFLGLGHATVTWGHRCGWQSASRTSQVSSFVAGHVTGYPQCDWEKEGRYFDIDAFTGLPMYHAQWNREIALDVPDLGGPWTTDAGTNILYYPFVRAFIPGPLVPETLAAYIMGWWYGALPVMSALGMLMLVFMLISVVTCYVGLCLVNKK